MHVTHIVADDFLPDPLKVREIALQLEYRDRNEGEIYPGRNATRSIPFTDIENVIGNLVHERLGAQTNYTSHATPRLALDGDKSKASIHMDMCHWSAMVYLSLDEHCQGGTHFYRHKPTGWEMAPAFPGMAEAAGYSTPDEALKDVLKHNGRDEENWEHTMTIPMKFNRLAVFRGYMWHDAGASFGSSPETGRLILPFFFDNLDRM